MRRLRKLLGRGHRRDELGVEASELDAPEQQPLAAAARPVALGRVALSFSAGAGAAHRNLRLDRHGGGGAGANCGGYEPRAKGFVLT